MSNFTMSARLETGLRSRWILRSLSPPMPSSSRLVVLDDGESRAHVYPEQGFQLHGFDVGLDGRRVPVIYGPPGPIEPTDRRYGNPVLFPSVGVSHGSQPDSWDHGGRALLMQPHGWARDLYWQIEEHDARSVTGLLVPTNGMRAAFPFPFSLRLRYRLDRRALVLDTTLENTGPTPFPYALGFHPYLRTPAGNPGRDRCRINLGAGTRLQTPDGWRTVTREAVGARTIGAADGELGGSIVLTDTAMRAMEVEDPTAGLVTRVSVEDSEQTFPVWVVWSAAPDAPYVCLEPWTDAPNALNRPDTRTIPAGATHQYRVTISARAI
jgi:galactose mutarotase-like enzyme